MVNTLSDLWLQLPREMQDHVIEQMDSETKNDFFSSSPDHFVYLPKNYVKQVEIRDNVMQIRSFDGTRFHIYFSLAGNGCEVTFASYGKETWNRIERFSRKTAMSIYFQRIIQKSPNLKKVILASKEFSFETTTIKHLKKLKYVQIHQENPIDLYGCGFMTPSQFPPNMTLKPARLATSNVLKEHQTIISDDDGDVTIVDMYMPAVFHTRFYSAGRLKRDPPQWPLAFCNWDLGKYK